MERALGSIFSGRRVVDSTALNAAGVQVFRALAARANLHARRTVYGTSNLPAYRQFARDGFCVVEDFLSEEEMAKIRAEFDGALGAGRSVEHVDPDRLGIELDTVHLEPSQEGFQNTESLLLRNPSLLSLVVAYEGWPNLSRMEKWSTAKYRFERCFRSVESPDEAADETISNSDVHRDIFYSITKAFYFLEDVDEHNGAFVFVPKSHRLSVRRLVYEYRQSLGRQRRRDSGRISGEELQAFGLEKRSLICKANTLVLFDGNCFHARGRFDPGTDRKIVYSEWRSNPFAW